MSESFHLGKSNVKTKAQTKDCFSKFKNWKENRYLVMVSTVLGVDWVQWSKSHLRGLIQGQLVGGWGWSISVALSLGAWQLGPGSSLQESWVLRIGIPRGPGRSSITSHNTPSEVSEHHFFCIYPPTQLQRDRTEACQCHIVTVLEMHLAIVPKCVYPFENYPKCHRSFTFYLKIFLE